MKNIPVVKAASFFYAFADKLDMYKRRGEPGSRGGEALTQQRRGIMEHK